MKYLADHKKHIFLIVVFIIIQYLMGKAFHIEKAFLYAQIILTIIFSIIIFTYDYMRKVSFYRQLDHHLKMKEKYLIIETLDRPSFYEGEIMHDALYEITKSMNEKIYEYQSETKNFKEYIEMWIHEVKTPISALSLMLHKDKNNKALNQLKRIENYTEQVLYYIRSQSDTQDYLIKEHQLDQCINHVLMHNKDELLMHHFTIETDHLDRKVKSDSKWLEFILNQIVSNAMKYHKENPLLRISATEDEDKVVLSIYDNGIGIRASDLPQVFKKSYTGFNGHEEEKSTGMGLFITKRLCDALHHGLTIDSKEGEYTKVTLIFYKEKYYVTKL